MANDPRQQAQHDYLGKDWERYFAFLSDKRLTPQGPGIGATRGLLPAPGEADVARTVSANLAIGRELDARDPRAGGNVPLDIAEHDLRGLRDQQTADRAMAIANDPRTSAKGRDIFNTDAGRYQTATRSDGELVAPPPVNRQQIAAQMAPGLIAPPAPPKPVTYGKPEPAMVTGPDGKARRVFVREGSDGLMYDTARRPIDPAALEPPPDKNAIAAGNTDVTDTVAGMIAGTLPPQMPGRASKDYLAVLGEAKRQGYDLAGAVTDWTATQKHVNTMNGAQQLRLNQAVNSLPEMLDSVESLAGQWKGTGFPILNKANLALAKGGAYGPEAASVANQLDAQIADVVADLGNVYMGGNSPTERALELAGKSLKGEWSEKVLRDMVGLAKKNVQIRRNSINNTGVAGASADNPYGNQSGGNRGSGTVEIVAPDGGILDVPAGEVDALLKSDPKLKRKGGG